MKKTYRHSITDTEGTPYGGSVEDSAEPHFVAIGRVTRPHGVNGEVRVELLTDVRERFEGLDRVFLGEKQPRQVVIESVRYHQNVVLLRFAGYATRDEADLLRGELLLVPEDEVAPLAAGEYYLYQAIGLDVYTEDEKLLGKVSEVLETGANNVFVVIDAGGKEHLLPDTPEVVRDMDIEKGRMIVNLLPGLLD